MRSTDNLYLVPKRIMTSMSESHYFNIHINCLHKAKSQKPVASRCKMRVMTE